MANINEISDFKLEKFVTVPEVEFLELARQLLKFMEKSNRDNLSYTLLEDGGRKTIWYEVDTFNFLMNYCATTMDQPISHSEAVVNMMAMLKDLAHGYNRDVSLVDEGKNDIVRWNCDAFDVCTYFLNPDPKPMIPIVPKIDESSTSVKHTILTIPIVKHTIPKIPNVNHTIPKIPNVKHTIPKIPNVNHTIPTIPNVNHTIPTIPKIDESSTSVKHTIPIVPKIDENKEVGSVVYTDIRVTTYDIGPSHTLYKELDYGFILKLEGEELTCLGVLQGDKIIEPSSDQQAKLTEWVVNYRPDVKFKENFRDESSMNGTPSFPEIRVTEYDSSPSRTLYKELDYGFILKLEGEELTCLGVLQGDKIIEPSSDQQAKLTEWKVDYRLDVRDVTVKA